MLRTNVRQEFSQVLCKLRIDVHADQFGRSFTESSVHICGTGNLSAHKPTQHLLSSCELLSTNLVQETTR